MTNQYCSTTTQGALKSMSSAKINDPPKPPNLPFLGDTLTQQNAFIRTHPEHPCIWASLKSPTEKALVSLAHKFLMLTICLNHWNNGVVHLSPFHASLGFCNMLCLAFVSFRFALLAADCLSLRATKTSMILGSNCAPAQRFNSANACSWVNFP